MKKIKEIDSLRKLHKVKKKDLCEAAGISEGMYSRYIKGSEMTAIVYEKMLNFMGYKISLIMDKSRLI